MTDDTDSATPQRVWVGTDDAIGDHSATELADLIASGTVSASEVVDAVLERADRAEPSIGAFATTDFDRARERATTPPSGRFAGVPIAIKDQTAVAGIPLRFGSRSLATRGPVPESSPMTRVFEQLGMVNLGTTTLPEFGLTSSSDFHHGPPTRNPWNPEHIAGGSSSGAAALVAAGVLPMAHGGDGGGSIRIPAAACGLVGLKPSQGRLPHENDEAGLPVKISAYGVLSRTVTDQCEFFAAAEPLHPQPALPPIGLVDRPLDRPLRFAVVTSSPANRTPSASAVDAVLATARLLESLGHHIEIIDADDDVLTDAFVDDFLLYWAFLASVLTLGGKKLLDPSFDRAGLTSVTRGLTAHARRNAHRIPGSIRRLKALPDTYHAYLGQADIVLSPTVSGPAPTLDHLGKGLDYDTHIDRLVKWASYTPLQNVVGAPAISLPLGFDHEFGLPIGVHFGSRVGQERLLLELALQLEEAQPFRHIPDHGAAAMRVEDT